MTEVITIPWEDVHDAQYDAGRVMSMLGAPPRVKKAIASSREMVKALGFIRSIAGTSWLRVMGRIIIALPTISYLMIPLIKMDI